MTLAETRPDPTTPGALTLFLDGLPSSHYNPADPLDVGFEYLEAMLAIVRNLPQAPDSALHLGAAGCSLPRALVASNPRSRHLAVDYDPVLVRVVREWFDLPRAPQLRIRAGDAREVLGTRPAASADLVVRDAFAAGAVPRHLRTVEFFADLRRVLAPQGIALLNIADSPGLAATRGEAASITEAWGPGASRLLVAEPGLLRGRRRANVVLALAGEEAPLSDLPHLARDLATCAIPLRLVTAQDGGELAALMGGGKPLHDRQSAPPGSEPSLRSDSSPGSES